MSTGFVKKSEIVNKLCVTWLSYRTSYRQETRIARNEGSEAGDFELEKIEPRFSLKTKKATKNMG